MNSDLKDPPLCEYCRADEEEGDPTGLLVIVLLGVMALCLGLAVVLAPYLGPGVKP